MAPKPTPSALKRAAGKQVKNKQEPKPTPGAPEPDTDLGPVARAAWLDVVERLESTGVLTQADRSLLRLYATTHADLVQAEADLAKFGPVMKVGKQGYLQISPYATLVRDLRRQIKAILAEMGLTPSARTKLKGSANPTPVTDWRELLDKEGE